MPGPACYGNGGAYATVTDASVVLGYLDADNFLGGAAKLDRDAAYQVIQQIGASLGVNELRAAEGVHRVINTHMAEGIRLATVRRGVDPRRFTLLGFGGAAGLHVTELARLLSLQRVFVPRVASVLSAWGMLATELRLESIRSHVGETDGLDAAVVQAIYEDLERQGISRMTRWFDGDIDVRRMAEMRYGEQIYEIDVSLDDIDLAQPDAMARLKTAFEHRHEELYTYSLTDQHPVLVNARVTTVGALPAPPLEVSVHARADAPPISERNIYLGEWIKVPVYSFTDLAAGQAIQGPAVVESDTTTVLLRPGDRAKTTPERWLDITIE